jgi:RNA polymerase sigma factor (TIGR02999 family)
VGNGHPGGQRRIDLVSSHPHEVTALLRAWGRGDETALSRLIPLVERELNRIARRCLGGERANGSLPATALVNEAFLRLVDLNRIGWQDRAHFLAMAARLMRRVLVDLARARRSNKRGGDLIRVSFNEALIARGGCEAELLDLDKALDALARLDPRKSQVVELKFFGGLELEEIAAALQVSSKTVARDWSFARAWLQREIAKGSVHDP